ncbi:MAG: SigE family RNA polymerase sigma factor [Nocardioides sp.]
MSTTAVAQPGQGGVRVVASPYDDEFAAYLAARQPALLRTAYLLTGNRADAEDIVQTALAKLYLSWGRVQSRDSVDGYVRRIMVNENSSLWRRAFKRREHSTDTLPEQATASAAQAVELGDRDRLLWDFVQTLPRKQRAVVVLRYYEELTEAEVADVLGISVGTVKSQASRALGALRQRVPSGLRDTPDPDLTPESTKEDR